MNFLKGIKNIILIKIIDPDLHNDICIDMMLLMYFLTEK
jgi:hypothetical protein